MFGWEHRAAASASRSRRSSLRSSRSPARTALKATVRPSSRSRASYTTPKPPRPTSRKSSNRPTTEPGASRAPPKPPADPLGGPRAPFPSATAKAARRQGLRPGQRFTRIGVRQQVRPPLPSKKGATPSGLRPSWGQFRAVSRAQGASHLLRLGQLSPRHPFEERPASGPLLSLWWGAFLGIAQSRGRATSVLLGRTPCLCPREEPIGSERPI